MQNARKEHDGKIRLRIEHADTNDTGKEYDKKMLAKEVMHPSLMNSEKVNTGIKDADGMKTAGKEYDKKMLAKEVMHPSLLNSEKVNTRIKDADGMKTAGKEYDKKMLAKEVMHPGLMNCEKVNTGIKDADGMKTAGKAFSILKTGEKLQTGEMYSEKGDKTEKCLKNMSIQHNGKEQIKEHGKNESSGEKTIASQYDKDVNILWFRNGIRLHDNGSLHNASQNTKVQYVLVNLHEILLLLSTN